MIDSEIVYSSATFSPCRKYRYALVRVWNESLPHATFIGLNPSTADEQADDPTVRRCIGFARAWGFGSVALGNLFALRATDPKYLLRVSDPVGPENDAWILRLQQESDFVVAAWGCHGRIRDRGNQVAKTLIQPYCLGLTRSGAPRHPLYLRGDTKPFLFPR